MHSSSWMNGPPPEAATQFNNNTMFNQRAGTTNITWQCRQMNNNVQPTNTQCFRGDGVFSKRTSDWQNLQGPSLTVTSQQASGQEVNHFFHGNQHHLSLKTHNGKSCLTNGVSSYQDFQQHSGFVNSFTPPNTRRENITYPQQDTAKPLTQKGLDFGRQSQLKRIAFLSKLQRCKLQKTLPPNVKDQFDKPISCQTIPAASHLYEDLGCTRKSVPSIADGEQIVYNRHNKPIGKLHVFSPSVPPPPYNIDASQMKRTSNGTATSEHVFQHSGVNQNTQQYQSQLNSTLENAESTAYQNYRSQMIISEIANDLCKSYTGSSKGSSYTGRQYISEDKMKESYQTSNSNTSLSLPLNSGLSSPTANHRSITKMQHNAEVPQQMPNVPDVLSVIATEDCYAEMRQGDNNRCKVANAVFPQSKQVLKESTNRIVIGPSSLIQGLKGVSPKTNVTTPSEANSQEQQERLKMLTSDMVDDSSIHSSSGKKGMKVVAVVQPLSLESCQQVASKHISSDTESPYADKSDVNQKSITYEALKNKSCSKDNNENSTEASVFQLSSVPTIPWTTEALTNLIQDNEKSQEKMSRDLMQNCVFNKIISTYQFMTGTDLINKIREGWYVNLMRQVIAFCNQHVTKESVILSQVKHGYDKQLQSYHVLKNGEVYSEPPYESQWLNVNKQLDDIDKEFGYSWCLAHGTNKQPDRALKVIPAQSVHGEPVKDLPPTELELDDSGEVKKHCPVEFTQAQTPSPKEADSDGSNDSKYSFEIQVLPPEEAKIIFEQASVTWSSKEAKLSEENHITQNDSELGKNSSCSVKEVCCLSRWLENICGSTTHSLSKCQCENAQTRDECTEKAISHEEKTSKQIEENLCVTVSNGLAEGENQEEGGIKIDSQTMKSSHPELCSGLDQAKASSEDDQDCHDSDVEPHKMSLSSQSSLLLRLLLSHSKAEDLSSDDVKTQSDTKVDCIQDGISDREKTCSDCTELKSTDVASDSSMGTEGQIPLSKMATPGDQAIQIEQKRPCKEECFPIFTESKRCSPPVDVDSLSSKNKEAIVDLTESESVASNARAVKLVLFGSKPQEEINMTDSKSPPKVLSVDLIPLKRAREFTQMQKQSAKQRVYENWKSSIIPILTSGKKTPKTGKSGLASLSGVCGKRAAAGGNTVAENLPLTSATRICSQNQNAKSGPSLKRRWHCDPVEPVEEKTDKSGKDRDNAAVPLQESNVLTFKIPKYLLP